MAKLIPRLKELETALKCIMMFDQMLLLIEKEIDKELTFEEKFRNLCSKMEDIVKNRAEYIEELERYPWLRDNVDNVETARVLKHSQNRDMEKDEILG
ncbi:hypothetical protein Tco_0483701 [Tanacetum coccineum]